MNVCTKFRGFPSRCYWDTVSMRRRRTSWERLKQTHSCFIFQFFGFYDTFLVLKQESHLYSVFILMFFCKSLERTVVEVSCFLFPVLWSGFFVQASVGLTGAVCSPHCVLLWLNVAWHLEADEKVDTAALTEPCRGGSARGDVLPPPLPKNTPPESTHLFLPWTFDNCFFPPRPLHFNVRYQTQRLCHLASDRGEGGFKRSSAIRTLLIAACCRLMI